MKYILTTSDLTKEYPNKLAVDKITMHIRKGDIYGFIGKNGAGKTTTMKLILGLTNKTSGHISLFGGRSLNKGRRKIGSLIEAPAFYKNLSAYDNLKMFSVLYGGTKTEIKEILKLVKLDDTGKTPVSNFSLGMKQRLGIAIALLGNPEMLILDEPINGLDPVAIKEIRDTLLELNKKGITILISSHLLDELQKITTRYGIVANGRLVEEIDAEELNKKIKNRLTITVNNVEKAVNILKSKGLFFKTTTYDNDKIYMEDHIEERGLINQTLVNGGVIVTELAFDANGFESYFLERIGE